MTGCPLIHECPFVLFPHTIVILSPRRQPCRGTVFVPNPIYNMIATLTLNFLWKEASLSNWFIATLDLFCRGAVETYCYGKSVPWFLFLGSPVTKASGSALWEGLAHPPPWLHLSFWEDALWQWGGDSFQECWGNRGSMDYVTTKAVKASLTHGFFDDLILQKNFVDFWWQIEFS